MIFRNSSFDFSTSVLACNTVLKLHSHANASPTTHLMIKSLLERSGWHIYHTLFKASLDREMVCLNCALTCCAKNAYFSWFIFPWDDASLHISKSKQTHKLYISSYILTYLTVATNFLMFFTQWWGNVVNV